MASALETVRHLQTAPARQKQLAVNPRILLADDQKELLEAVKSILSCEFTVVGTAEDGLHAVELALNLKPDILVLDISMPVVNGIEAACRLRGNASQIKI